MKIFLVLINLYFSLVFISCGTVTGLVEKGGRFLEGGASRYKIDTRWEALSTPGLDVQNIRWEDGKTGIVFSTPDVPFITFYGTLPEDDGIFYITRARFLAGNYGGWNEFDIEISGIGRIRPLGDGAISFVIFGEINLQAITNGKIRREDTRLIGNRALEELVNRNERIIALTAWMKQYAAENHAPDFANDDDFEKYWRNILFPGKSPPSGALPEELQMLRESGALDADWDEALSWIYLYYEWKKMIGALNREVILMKT
jgi:hypothetical protein